MAEIFTAVFVISLTIFFNALYVAAEFAIVKARHSKSHIAQLADTGNPMARQLSPVLQDQKKLDNFVAACQLGITVSSLVLGAYGQAYLTPGLSPMLSSLFAPVLSIAGLTSQTLAISISAGVVLLILTVLQMVIGELVPKSIAVQHPEKVAMATIYPVGWSRFLLHPFIKIFNGSGDVILRLLGINYHDAHGDSHSIVEIERLVTQTHEGGLIDDKEKQMLRNAFRMRGLTARQVMVPRMRMVAAPSNSRVPDILTMSIDAGYSRIPIYENTIDNIIGFVHIKDLFRQHLQGKDDLAGLIREVAYVPDTLPITSVWDTLNENWQYMVVVFDEHGGTEGLITFEDVIEEIFGELQDEYDEHEQALISRDEDGRTHLRSDLLITDINEYLNLTLPEEANTLGGLLLIRLGHPPNIGEEVAIDGLMIRVETISNTGVADYSIELPVDEQIQIREWEVSTDE